jgi:peptide/nickel transport system permease protein
MGYTIRQVFHSGKFVVGFSIFVAILLIVIIYPLIVRDAPLAIIAQGTFFPPGIYVNTYDSIASPAYILNLEDAIAKRVASKLSNSDRTAMKEWLVLDGIPEAEINISDTAKLLSQWEGNYDPKANIPGMTNAKRNYYVRLNNSLRGLLSTEGAIIAAQNSQTGALDQTGIVNRSDYVNIGEVANVRVLPLGTDNFGRDANLFTVIPTFVLLILISFSIGQERRGPITIAVVIGFTNWVWTTRAVRAQVISLRNRDHVNLSKLSGHSIAYIIVMDILPYIASYVVMALILQISAGILTEAGLSILGLGPRTTVVPTLGLMMNWAMIYQAQILGKWWAYFPVIVVIALIAFSMNLMNTGLDQIFNPALRE